MFYGIFVLLHPCLELVIIAAGPKKALGSECRRMQPRFQCSPGESFGNYVWPKKGCQTLGMVGGCL